MAENKDEFGSNAETSEFGNLLAAEVIGPSKVVCFAVQNAASVADLMITTETMITEKPRKKKASAAPPMDDNMY